MKRNLICNLFLNCYICFIRRKQRTNLLEKCEVGIVDRFWAGPTGGHTKGLQGNAAGRKTVIVPQIHWKRTRSTMCHLNIFKLPHKSACPKFIVSWGAELLQPTHLSRWWQRFLHKHYWHYCGSLNFICDTSFCDMAEQIFDVSKAVYRRGNLTALLSHHQTEGLNDCPFFGTLCANQDSKMETRIIFWCACSDCCKHLPWSGEVQTIS